jgi:hypothetical protein
MCLKINGERGKERYNVKVDGHSVLLFEAFEHIDDSRLIQRLYTYFMYVARCG